MLLRASVAALLQAGIVQEPVHAVHDELGA